VERGSAIGCRLRPITDNRVEPKPYARHATATIRGFTYSDARTSASISTGDSHRVPPSDPLTGAAHRYAGDVPRQPVDDEREDGAVIDRFKSAASPPGPDAVHPRATRR
jgi:hypothetical protein